MDGVARSGREIGRICTGKDGGQLANYRIILYVLSISHNTIYLYTSESHSFPSIRHLSIMACNDLSSNIF